MAVRDWPTTIQIRLTQQQWNVCEKLAGDRTAEAFAQELFDRAFKRMSVELFNALIGEDEPKAKAKPEESIPFRVKYPPGSIQRATCPHTKTERFEDDAMYRCLDCGAEGIVGSGRPPV